VEAPVLTKDRKRAERRYRTQKKLRQRIRYYKDIDWWGDWMTDRHLGILKNTTKSCNHWYCSNPRRWMAGNNKEALTVAERRTFQPEEDRQHGRKKRNRDLIMMVKIQCMSCGYHLGWTMRQVGKHHTWYRFRKCRHCIHKMIQTGRPEAAEMALDRAVNL
jgi:hypothetical protein